MTFPRLLPGIFQTSEQPVANQQDSVPTQTGTIPPLFPVQPGPRNPQPCTLLWTSATNKTPTVALGVISSQNNSKYSTTNPWCSQILDQIMAGRRAGHLMALPIPLQFQPNRWSNLFSLSPTNRNWLAPIPIGTPELTLGSRHDLIHASPVSQPKIQTCKLDLHSHTQAYENMHTANGRNATPTSMELTSRLLKQSAGNMHNNR